MPFEHNKALRGPLAESCSHVIRNYPQMLGMLSAQNKILDQLSSDLSRINFLQGRDHHEDNCDACVIISNMTLRMSHDVLVLQALQLLVATNLSLLSKKEEVNTGPQHLYISVATTTRAVIETLIRSSAMYLNADIRTYNKYLAESLHSFKQAKWGSLTHNIDTSGITSLMDAFSTMSNRDRNNSNLYSDPFPTFKSKIEYLASINQQEGFYLLDKVSDFYSTLSDLVHGGFAFLSASNFKRNSTVVGSQKLTMDSSGEIILKTGEYSHTASATQLLEFTGICQFVALKMMLQLYTPIVRQTFHRIPECQEIEVQLSVIHDRLVVAMCEQYF